MRESYLIACTIDRGGFTSERTFEIKLPGGEKLVGTAYIDYLLDHDKKKLDDDTPGYGQPIHGFVVCRKLRDIDERVVLVEVPSADVIRVSTDSLTVLD